ncbi:MAG: KpsF/GutQ family sugar-phosphate isomerase [Rhodospirillales bacterium]|nr:KpsF/GutQ family sugar-phosphate isomerase [Rhodospirillales bacterium]
MARNTTIEALDLPPNDTEADVSVGRRVLQLEAEGLLALCKGLNGDFGRAVQILADATGRVIVSGMGKSGHIARKIAATLASTGTPAQFVHPGEASHGDLGMITKGDAALLLSNSGETDELKDLVAYTRRFSIPMIGISSGARSSLLEAADVALVLPGTPEACPMGLAPTTSTTMMLALGDALCVGLMERKGFSSDQYQVLHPGGSLGQSLIRVEEIMHTGEAVPLVAKATPMSDVLLVMTAKGFGCAGVCDPSGKILGVITDGDLRRNMTPALLGLRADQVMTPDPKVIRRKALGAEALGKMNATAITCLFVVEDHTPVGIIHVQDCLRAGIA